MAARLRRYRLVRGLIQFAFLILFVVLFVRTRYNVSPVLGDVFFRFDPLVLLVASIALRAVVTATLLALILIVATLVFGRFFCGFICPLGTIIDLFDAATRRRPAVGTRLRNGKYALLLFLVVAAFFGASFVGFLDPLAITERSLTLLFHPAYALVHQWFVAARPTQFAELRIALVTFLGLVALGLIAPRFWCRNLCPLGGMYGILSKVALFKFSFAGECTNCGLCQNVCPTGAIDSAQRKIDSAECIDCMACACRCPKSSIAYRVQLAPVPFDAGRREAILMGAGILVAPVAAKLLKPRTNDYLLRPPGAIPEPEFLDTCIRCERCIKACPTTGLQPCVLEAGAVGLWTPRLVPRIGPCERNCHLCGQVCPTGAIRKLSLDEKNYAFIGTAIIDRDRCIAWAENKTCLICDEACPYNAIDSLNRVVDGIDLGRPFVDKGYCVGCGSCELRCPVTGAAAIRVFAIGADRKQTGSYKNLHLPHRECGTTPEEDVPSGFTQ